MRLDERTGNAINAFRRWIPAQAGTTVLKPFTCNSPAGLTRARVGSDGCRNRPTDRFPFVGPYVGSLGQRALPLREVGQRG